MIHLDLGAMEDETRWPHDTIGPMREVMQLLVSFSIIYRREEREI